MGKVVLLLLAALSLFAHKIEGISLNIQKTGDKQISVEAFSMKGGAKKLHGNKARLVSMIDKRVLAEGRLSKKEGLVFEIPTESYWVYVYVGEQDAVKEGPPPSGGFLKSAKEQQNRAFNYTASTALCLFFGAFAMAAYKGFKFRRSAR